MSIRYCKGIRATCINVKTLTHLVKSEVTNNEQQ